MPVTFGPYAYDDYFGEICVKKSLMFDRLFAETVNANCNCFVPPAFNNAYDGKPVRYAYGLFAGLTNIKKIDFSFQDWSILLDIECMFQNDVSLEDMDMSSLVMSKIGSTAGMFYNCTHLRTIDLHNQSLCNVTKASEILSKCYSLQIIDISSCENLLVLKDMFIADLPNLKHVFVKNQGLAEFVKKLILSTTAKKALHNEGCNKTSVIITGKDSVPNLNNENCVFITVAN